MIDLEALSTDLLPKRLQEFVRLVGLPATLKIVERHGGTRLHVPKEPRAEHPLAALIGYDNMVVLCKAYGGEEHFDIPRAVRALRHLRDTRIRTEYATRSAADLAREHALTERQVFKIVGRQAPAADERQEALFDFGVAQGLVKARASSTNSHAGFESLVAALSPHEH